MSSIFANSGLLLCILLVLQRTQINEAREMRRRHVIQPHHDMDDHLKLYDHHDHDQMNHDRPSSHMGPTDPSEKIFFTINDLKIGKKIEIYFSKQDPSKSPPLISREKSDLIPFSSSKLEFLIKFFNFTKNSPQSKAMEMTFAHCEAKPMPGETKFCATSLESMLDSTRGVFGLDSRFKVLTTTYLTKLSTQLQNYTVLERPQRIVAPKFVGCHVLAYPYAVFYCHSQVGDNRLYEVLLGGDGGDRVKAVVACHVDTSMWAPDHASFRVLGTRPGESSVCHVFPADNLVWVPSPPSD